MAENNENQSDFEDIFASFDCQNAMDLAIAREEDPEVEIVEEVETCFENHSCDLCCEGNFLVDKMLRFGGVINQSRRYGCEICCRGLWKKGDFIKHKKLHESGEIDSEGEGDSIPVFDPFSNSVLCEYCHVTFKSSRGLHQHIAKRHKDTLSKVHTCEICRESFQDFKRFTLHCALHSSKNQTFQCFSCKKKFTYKKSLKDHVCTIK